MMAQQVASVHPRRHRLRWLGYAGAGLAALVGTVVPAGIAAAQTPPVVNSVSPDFGPLAGGTTVTIAGVGFTGETAVDFGGVAATNVTFNSDSSVTATSPSSPSSLTVDVTVTTPDGTSATNTGDEFTYTGHVPPANSFIVGSGSAATYALNE